MSLFRAFAFVVAFLTLSMPAFSAESFVLYDIESPGYGAPGFTVTSNGLRINGIQPNPTNRVIVDNDMFADDPGFFLISAMHKLGKVNLRGIIITNQPNNVVRTSNVTYAVYATGTAESTPPPTEIGILGLEDASGTRQQDNSLDAIRFVAGSSFSAETMNARFTSSTASGVLRMAIYADNGGRPGALLGSTAQISVSGGVRSAALNAPVQISQGQVYWIATWVQLATTTNVTFVANDGVGTRYRAAPTYSATGAFPGGSILSYSPRPFQAQIDEYNMLRKEMLDSGLYAMPHTEGARQPLYRPSSNSINDTEYTSSPGSRLIIQEALDSTPDNPLLVFVGGQATTVATALLENPSIANRMIIMGAQSLPASFNTYNGWAVYVAIMRAPYVNLAEAPWRDAPHESHWFDQWPDNLVRKRMVGGRGFRLVEGYCDSPAIVWLLDQSLFTGANGRNVTHVSFRLKSRPDCELASVFLTQVSGPTYGVLNIQRADRRVEDLMRTWTSLGLDSRVWDPIP